jgi:hypothetical protein
MGDPEAEARAHLSQDAAQRAIKEGRTMSVDAALALAVGEDATTEAPAGSGTRLRRSPGFDVMDVWRPSLSSWEGRPWALSGQPGSTGSW